MRSDDDVDLLHGDAPGLGPQPGDRNLELDGPDHPAPDRDGRIDKPERIRPQRNIFELDFAWKLGPGKAQLTMGLKIQKEASHKKEHRGR